MEAGIGAFLPLILMQLIFILIGNRLAKDKGRSVLRWTILSFIPFIGIFLTWFLIGASDKGLEQKIDRVLALLEERR